MTPESPDNLPTAAPKPDRGDTPKRKPQGKKRRGPAVPAAFGKDVYVDRSAVYHQARVLAMQSLYEMDSVQHPIEDIIERLREDDVVLPESVAASTDEDEAVVDDVPQPVADHAIALVEGVTSRLDEIDPVIQTAASQFPVDQLAIVDRNVLRLAIYELQYVPEVPYKVAINEAVEIAKRFGGPNSGRFVNGVLGTISRQLPAERTTPPGKKKS